MTPRRGLPVAPLALVLMGALACAGAALPTAAAGSVLVVGDSLGVGTEGPLRGAAHGVEIEADNLSGRTSSAGVSILGGLIGPEHDTVVFDLGTNDGPSGTATTLASMAAARDIAAGRCLVLATLNHPPVGGASIDATNAALRRFALETPNAVLVDWHGAAAAVAGVLQPDGVHATASGYAYRGALFAEAIASCLAGGGGGGGAAPGGARPRGGPAPPPSQPASTTERPATTIGAPRPRRHPSPAERFTRSVADRLTGDGGPLDVAVRAGATVAAAAESAGDALTPRGPEPVLGAPR